MPAKNSTAKSVEKPSTSSKGSQEAAPAPEADFNDTIASNRALALLDPEKVPDPPKKYKSTDPNIRARRLRRIAADHRSEAAEALRQVAKRDVQADLGKNAPDGARANGLLERMTQSGLLLDAANRLIAYAKEMDQIALSDAFLFLEKTNKYLATALEDEPHLEKHYSAVKKLFDARSEAIVEGMRAGSAEPATSASGEPSDK